MDHQNVLRVREALDAYNRGDMASFTEHLAADITWHVGGQHPLSGDYHGHGEVVGYFEKVRAMTEESIQLEPIEILADDNHAGLFMRATAKRLGRTLDTVLAEAVRFDEEGRWLEYWALAEDQGAVDEFWKEAS